MKKYYPFKDKEELLETIEYLKDKLNKSTTNDDKFYLDMFRLKRLFYKAECLSLLHFL